VAVSRVLMATADRMCYVGWTCLLSDEFSAESVEMQLSQYQHQSTPVPSASNVCPVLWCRNMDLLGCRHEDSGGFSHEMSVTDN